MAILELILLLLLLLFGGVRQDVSQQPIVVDEAVSAATVQDLIDYGSPFFPDDDGWTLFFSQEEDDGPSVAWTDGESEVVIHIFEQTIPIADPVGIVMSSSWIEGDFSEGYIDVVSKLDCEAGGVYLYHLSLEFADEPYVARVWQYYVDDRLIRGVRLVFPARRQVELESYAQLLFPDFYTCDI